MSFQVGIGSLGGTISSGGTLYPFANYVSSGDWTGHLAISTTTP